MPIIEAAGYEVDLSVEPARVQVVKMRKAPKFGYGYQPGADVYRSTIKVGSPNWKRAVKAAKEKAAADAEPAISATLTVYRLVGERAETIKAVPLTAPKADMLATLAAVRSGLPADCGATLVDARGYNIRP